MSIVGTRPPLISETNLYEPRHKVRLAIKPGITGMWQVSGRSDITDFEEVVRLDKPDVVICTGVLAMIPICLISKLMGKKLIYIESFAKVTSPTETGKLLYKFADQFYVQWKPMLKFYPKAIYLGGIY